MRLLTAIIISYFGFLTSQVMYSSTVTNCSAVIAEVRTTLDRLRAEPFANRKISTTEPIFKKIWPVLTVNKDLLQSLTKESPEYAQVMAVRKDITELMFYGYWRMILSKKNKRTPGFEYLSDDEKMEIASIALLNAVQKFDPDYVSGFTNDPVKFSTYYYKTLRNDLLKSLLYGSIYVTTPKFILNLDSIEDLTFIPGIVDPAPDLYPHEVENLMVKLRKNLTEREFQILYFRFIEGESLREVGIRFELTAERIRQLQGNAIDHARRILELAQLVGLFVKF